VIDLCQTNTNIITGPFYTYRRRITYISPVEVHRLSYLSVLTINPPGPHVTAASWFRIDISVAALKPIMSLFLAAFRRLSGHEQTRGIITTCRLVYTSLYKPLQERQRKSVEKTQIRPFATVKPLDIGLQLHKFADVIMTVTSTPCNISPE